jgi:hypothetical protein
MGQENMSQIEIQTGLRRLEFSSERQQRQDDEQSEVLVEFVRGAPLLGNDIVRVPLGRRGPLLRELSGRPLLIRTDVREDGSTEYHYRIRGPIESRQDAGLQT